MPNIWKAFRATYQPQYRTFVVEYDCNGGDGPAPVDPNTYTYAIDEVTILANTCSRAGFSFTGWTTVESSETPMYQPGDQAIFQDTGGASVSLYAVWNVSDPFSPPTDGNGGGGFVGSGD